MCIALCTIVAHNIAQNRPDSFPPYPPDNHHCSDDVYLREGGSTFPCTIKSRSSLLAPAHLDGPRKRAVKQLCMCACGDRVRISDRECLSVSCVEWLINRHSDSDDNVNNATHTHRRTHVRLTQTTWQQWCVTLNYFMAALCNSAGHIHFHPVFLLSLFFFLA